MGSDGGGKEQCEPRTLKEITYELLQLEPENTDHQVRAHSVIETVKLFKNLSPLRVAGKSDEKIRLPWEKNMDQRRE